jgi:DNA (cytosine-5)-methyltransferase 1
MNSIELFSGGGGLALGLVKSGFHHKAIVELNKNACKTIRANSVFDFGRRLYEGSVVNFDYKKITDGIDLIAGGPPCQPFSLGGKAKGNEDSRDMFPQAIRAIREKKPKAFIFENVKGLMRKSFSAYLEYITLQLQYPSVTKNIKEPWQKHKSRLEHHNAQSDHDLEYKVTCKLVNAADYGIPQKRERIFFIGFRSDIDPDWAFPKPTHSEESLIWDKWISGDYWTRHNLPIQMAEGKMLKRVDNIRKKYHLLKPQSLPWVTVRDALCDLPNCEHKEASNYNQHVFKSGAKIYPGHTGSYIDEPSKALKAGAHGVPGGENMIRYEDGSVRYYTIRESARIQAFPDDYIFEGSWGEVMRQLGNAVPAKLAEQIGLSVFAALDR